MPVTKDFVPKTHCLRGHPRTEENIYGPRRHCKVCGSIKQKERAAANKKVRIIPTHCKNGHTRNTENWRKVCLICKREFERRMRQDPQGRKIRHAIEKHYRKTKRPNVLAAQRLIKYGVDRHGYERMLADQGGKCFICKSTFDESHQRSKSCIDHDHDNGKIRGLLCTSCNSGIGLLKESEEVFLTAIAYLKNPPAFKLEGLQKQIDPSKIPKSSRRIQKKSPAVKVQEPSTPEHLQIHIVPKSDGLFVVSLFA